MAGFSVQARGKGDWNERGPDGVPRRLAGKGAVSVNDARGVQEFPTGVQDELLRKSPVVRGPGCQS